MSHVYLELREHQKTEEWKYRALFEELHRWAEILILEFKLNLTDIALMVDRIRPGAFGHFRPGHNGFGLQAEVAINARYLDKREFWQVLGTLLHELLHAWQEAHGKPGFGNYHNREFRQKAESLGLLIDKWGHTQYVPASPFIDVLMKHGIQVPDIPVPTGRIKGQSKLRKWSCGCTNVRVAVADFEAVCLRCGNKFAQQA